MLKKLINNGELISCEIVEEYHGASPAMVFYFYSHRPMFVRWYRFKEYIEYLSSKGIEVKSYLEE